MDSNNNGNSSDGGDDLDDFFGQAKNGGSDMNWKTHALSETEPNIFRIAPPVKSLKSVGKWKVYDRLHYGYTVPNDQNPDKPRHRPFKCIEKKNRATGMVEQDCPECSRMAAKNEEVEALKAKYISEGKSETEAEEYVRGARKLLKPYNLDKKWYLLAKNLAGEWGTLKLGHRAMTALDDERNAFMKKNGGEDPLNAASGYWFEFTRQGKNLDTRYTAKLALEDLGNGQFQRKPGTLTRLDAEALKKCPDLARLNDNKVLSYDQIQALVRSGGDPTVVATIFGQSNRRQEQPTQAAAPTPQPQVQTAPATPVAASQAAPAQVDPRAALLAQLAALDAAQAVAKGFEAATGHKVVSVTTSAPEVKKAAPATAQAPVGDLMKLDPQEFLAMFPDPNKR